MGADVSTLPLVKVTGEQLAASEWSAGGRIRASAEWSLYLNQVTSTCQFHIQIFNFVFECSHQPFAVSFS
jgi:hypothetical protein